MRLEPYERWAMVGNLRDDLQRADFTDSYEQQALVAFMDPLMELAERVHLAGAVRRSFKPLTNQEEPLWP